MTDMYFFFPRDSSVKINYRVVSEASFANRHSVDISWTKPQEVPLITPGTDVEIIADPNRVTITMATIATPDTKQSEAYVATSAIFYIFSGNTREEKVGLRLPPVWRDLFSELAEAKKNHLDSQDRTVVRGLRTLVRQRRDQELEDGVIIQGAFRGRGTPKGVRDSSDNGNRDQSRPDNTGSDHYRKIWADKSSTRKYQTMLVSPPLYLMMDEQTVLLTRRLAISHATPHVELQGPGIEICGTKPSGHRLR